MSDWEAMYREAVGALARVVRGAWDTRHGGCGLCGSTGHVGHLECPVEQAEVALKDLRLEADRLRRKEGWQVVDGFHHG